MDFSIRKIVVAALVALVLTVAVRAASVPAYLNVDGATVTGCVKDELPESLVIPDGIKGIGRGAFKGCGGLKTVTIPESVRSIGEDAFADCGIKTVQYKGTLAQWCQIESDSGFLSVKTITLSDVADLKEVSALTIPEGVKSIGNNAFRGCSALKTITIPGSVSSIGEETFKDCSLTTVQYKITLAQWLQMDNIPRLFSSVKTITLSDVVDLKAMSVLVIPDGVSRIGKYALDGLRSLTSITIPNSVKVIDDMAFSSLGSIATVQYKGTLAQWCQMDNDVFILQNASTITMSDVANLKAMTALKIPDGVTRIGKNAFYACRGLKTVTIPESVRSIGEKAFYLCNIKTVQYKGTLAQWCQMDSDVFILQNASTITMSDVADLKAMTALTIPDTVTRIGKSAFKGCGRLISVTIPKSVTSIGDYAFADCSGIMTVILPDSVKSIGDKAFYDCKSLKTVQYKGTFAQWCQMDNDSALLINAKAITMFDMADLKAADTLTIPNNIKNIGKSAFYGCSGLMSVTISESVKNIGGSAFYGCSGLTSITIPKGVESIGDEAFRGCIEITSVTISEGVKSIGESAFYGCNKLTAVTIGDGVENIGDFAFRSCSRLVGVTIPVSVKSIGRSAFSDCKSLSVQFSGTVAQLESVSMGNFAFWGRPTVQCTDGDTVINHTK